MTPRERVLLSVVGGLFGLMVAGGGGYWAMLRLGDQDRQVMGLEDRLNKLKLRIAEAQIASRQFNDYERRSLPANLSVAKIRYTDYLTRLVEKQTGRPPTIQIKGQRVAMIDGGGPDAKVFDVIPFTVVIDEIRLPNLVALLHDFYAIDRLQRIQQLNISRLDPRRLKATLDIETIAMTTAAEDAELIDAPGRRLSAPSLADYQEAISNRNMFGLANAPPRLTSSTNQRGDVGRTVAFEISAEDDNTLDQLTAALGEGVPQDAVLEKVRTSGNRTSWVVRFRPTTTGTVTFPVTISDDGLPARSIQTKVAVNISDPPPPPRRPDPPPPTPTPSFDRSRFTQLTTIFDRNGLPYILLNDRTRGELSRFYIGDTVSVGDYKAIVEAISQEDNRAWLRTVKGLVELAPGQFLSEGEVIEPAAETASNDPPLFEDEEDPMEGEDPETTGPPPEGATDPAMTADPQNDPDGETPEPDDGSDRPASGQSAERAADEPLLDDGDL